MVESRADLPTEEDARAVVRAVLRDEARTVTRFPTGLAHYVYDVVTAQDHVVVVRMARRDRTAGLAGAIYWSNWLRPLGIPLAQIIHADLRAEVSPFPSLVLERLPGTDLGNVYPQLSLRQKHSIVKDV